MENYDEVSSGYALITSFKQYDTIPFTETVYLPLRHYANGQSLLELPKDNETFSDVPLYDARAEFLNSKYAAFDLVDLLGYSLLLSDYREGSLLSRAEDKAVCESAILSADIALTQAGIGHEDISLRKVDSTIEGYTAFELAADFEEIYEIIGKAVSGCAVEIEFLKLDDIKIHRDIQKMIIEIEGEKAFQLELMQREFKEKSPSPRSALLSFNSQRVSFVVASDICKSRPIILNVQDSTWPLARYATPPPHGVSLCSAVTSAYQEDQAELVDILNFHSIASYVEAFSKKEGELPFQREVIDFMQTINPAAAEALSSGEMYYSIIEQSCDETSVESCQVYQILISHT